MFFITLPKIGKPTNNNHKTINKMKKNLQNLLLLLVALMGLQAAAAIPSGYYNTALGKSDQALMTALHQKIHGHYPIYYRNNWSKFQITDCNGNTIIDRYSNTQFTYSTDQCGTYSGVGDCYNREHSVPNSWWGGSNGDTDTMYHDLYHIYPVDGFVNNQRSSYPYGDCNNGTVYGTGKLGNCTHSGYSGIVFEVADEYKGDFARTFFYMVVRYMNRVGSWTSNLGSVVFTNSSYKHLTPWAISQLMEWHRNDPVSTLETTRNEAVYGIQHNRNPFIDHPELAEYLWGNQTGNAWTGSAINTPTISSPVNGSTINVGTNTGSGVSKVITVKGVYLTNALTVSVTGTGFSVTPSTLTAAAVNAGTTVTLTYNGTTANATGRLTISSSEVSNSTTLTATYNAGGGGTGTETVETWEGCAGYGSYTDKAVQGKSFAWYFTNAGIWDDTHRNDELSCRFGYNSTSCITMTEDLTDGASKITFYAAKWNNNEATPTLQVQYSTDAGNTWNNVGTCSPNNTWQQYIFNMNVTGNVRIKILQTAGARLNIDDIAITSNPASVVVPELTSPVNGSTLNVGTITGNATQVTKTITVKGSNLTKTLSLTASGTGFSVSPRMISASNANAGTTVTVTYTATQPGDATGTLVISSSEVNAIVYLTAGKVAMPEIQISPLDRIEAVNNGESGVVTGIVSADNNEESITLTVGSAFKISLDQVNWSNTLTLDPSGEVFYVRLASTATIGTFSGTVTASTSQVTAYADIEGVVTPFMGDVNMDGQIDVADVTALISYILGNQVTPFNVAVADVNEDDAIDVGDVTSLIAIILGSNVSIMQWSAVPAADGVIVQNPLGEKLEVYNMDADCVAKLSSVGVSTIALPLGTYVVTSDTVSRKVVVK